MQWQPAIQRFEISGDRGTFYEERDLWVEWLVGYMKFDGVTPPTGGLSTLGDLMRIKQIQADRKK